MNDKLVKAGQKFADAWDDIAESRQELANSEATLADEQKDAEQKIAEARAPVRRTKRQMAEAEGKLATGEAHGGPRRHADPSGGGGVFITQNAARILGVKPGDTVSLQDMELVQHETVISGVVRNYLGNNVYVTQKLCESLFGDYAPNGVLAHLSDACPDQAAYAEELLDNDFVVSAVSTAALRERILALT